METEGDSVRLLISVRIDFTKRRRWTLGTELHRRGLNRTRFCRLCNQAAHISRRLIIAGNIR